MMRPQQTRQPVVYSTVPSKMDALFIGDHKMYAIFSNLSRIGLQLMPRPPPVYLSYSEQSWSFLLLYCSIAQLWALWNAHYRKRLTAYYVATTLTFLLFLIIERRAQCDRPVLCTDYLETQDNLLKLFALCAPFYAAGYAFMFWNTSVIDFKTILWYCITMTNSPLVVYLGILGTYDSIAKLKAGQLTFLEQSIPQFFLFLHLSVIWFGGWLFIYSIEKMRDNANSLDDVEDVEDEEENMLAGLEKV